MTSVCWRTFSYVTRVEVAIRATDITDDSTEKNMFKNVFLVHLGVAHGAV